MSASTEPASGELLREARAENAALAAELARQKEVGAAIYTSGATSLPTELPTDLPASVVGRQAGRVAFETFLQTSTSVAL